MHPDRSQNIVMINTPKISVMKKIVFGVDCKRNPNLKHETKDRLKSEVQANTAI